MAEATNVKPPSGRRSGVNRASQSQGSVEDQVRMESKYIRLGGGGQDKTFPFSCSASLRG